MTRTLALTLAAVFVPLALVVWASHDLPIEATLLVNAAYGVGGPAALAGSRMSRRRPR